MVCNPLYTAYFTTAHKDRLTIVDVLRNLHVRTFRVNAETIDLLRIFGVAQHTVRSVQGLPQNQDWREAEFTALLDARLPTLGPQQRRASWKPLPLPPTTPNWRFRSSSCCSAMMPPNSTG